MAVLRCWTLNNALTKVLSSCYYSLIGVIIKIVNDFQTLYQDITQGTVYGIFQPGGCVLLRNPIFGYYFLGCWFYHKNLGGNQAKSCMEHLWSQKKFLLSNSNNLSLKIALRLPPLHLSGFGPYYSAKDKMMEHFKTS